MHKEQGPALEKRRKYLLAAAVATALAAPACARSALLTVPLCLAVAFGVLPRLCRVLLCRRRVLHCPCLNTTDT